MAERDVLKAANEACADDFSEGDLPMPPGRRLAIVTCMDACLDRRSASASRSATRT
jgi:carbonic anhydrase